VLIHQIEEAIAQVKCQPIDANERHLQVSRLYCWENVALRTEKVYQHILSHPAISLVDRCYRFYGVGFFSGVLAMMVVIFDHVVYDLLEWFFPRDQIEKAPLWK
jgi:phosphatidylinositol glycan class A protein